MKALFILNDWSIDLWQYDLIVCSHNYRPDQLRARGDVKDTAKLAAYVCFDSIEALPWGQGTGASTNERLHARLAKPELLMPKPADTPDNAPGYVTVAGWPSSARFFSSYPWPKPSTARDRVDFAPKIERARIQADAFAHEIDLGWDILYVDECRPTPEWQRKRFRDAGLPGWSDPRWVAIRSEALLDAFLKRLRALRDEPIIGNTGGWTSPLLDGICIEKGKQQPEGAMSQIQAVSRFGRQAIYAARNGRGHYSLDFSARLDRHGVIPAWNKDRDPKPEGWA